MLPILRLGLSSQKWAKNTGRRCLTLEQAQARLYGRAISAMAESLYHSIKTGIERPWTLYTKLTDLFVGKAEDNFK
jgi:hypothetical protein